MPNFSHGTAGVASALALAGVALDRPELVEAAVHGAEEVVALGSPDVDGLAVPHVIPEPPGYDEDDARLGLVPRADGHVGALRRARAAPASTRLPDALRTTGTASACAPCAGPGSRERRHPGFWDNDGRCCGTAGVGDTILDAWQRGGGADDLAFAVRLADAILEHAVVEGDRACWRFVEHRNEDPLLPPGIGWYAGRRRHRGVPDAAGAGPPRGPPRPCPRADGELVGACPSRCGARRP